ncbi:low molecular weight phosphatase family protein [Allomuricauda sp. F6463D]|uniref:arsenate-mycothiol transferase ArsC n=1 Tax=Allomuricauda sp. F6463D TaxID=2926409 RepID=UPI001FF6928F|nr:protein-tyrosine-phosphatase [Muricauda sp. F6463D]MCK0159758.1 protein-tyrosine-phosphatase [Muricauda sp. F6463D]
MSIFQPLNEFISGLESESISEERKQTLAPLVDYIQKKVGDGESVRINFICTHNSRRSHLSQVWAQTMAHYFRIENVSCYSGGTEATALFPKVADTLTNTGFEVNSLSAGNNPVYSIKFSSNEHSVIGFSKRMDSDFNPKSEFAAIMTCSQADEGCPFVPGAEKRIPITYEDPKVFDDTPQQAEKYSERSKQIASEMFYIFSQIQK